MQVSQALIETEDSGIHPAVHNLFTIHDQQTQPRK